jgi:hypothetical protein
MINTWQLITNKPAKINTRQFQNKGTNKGSSLLISMVAQNMQREMQHTKPDGSPSKIYGTSLQYHSTPTLLKALRNKNKLKELHCKITTNYYPTPMKELSPATIPTIFQTTKRPYTAMDDIDSLTAQESEMIMTTYCERFYPQVTKQTIAELQNSTDKEIRQML